MSNKCDYNPYSTDHIWIYDSEDAVNTYYHCKYCTEIKKVRK